MNEETNKLGLIEEKFINAGFLGKTISAASGFSKEIFQGGSYMGSVRLPADSATLSAECSSGLPQLKIRYENILLIVNLGPQTMLLQGTFSTKDRYTASYEIAMEIRIHNPQLFAQRYLQKSDPIGLLKSAILQDLDEYAARTEHNELSTAKLRHDVRYNIQSAKIGLLVAEIYKSQIYADPRMARILEMEQNAEVDKANINISFDVDMLRDNRSGILQSHRNENERNEQAKASQFARDEHKRQKDALEQERLQTKALDMFSEHWGRQVAMEIDGNASIYEIAAKDPMLRNALSSILPSNTATGIDSDTQPQLETERQIKQEQKGLPSSTPPDTKNVPQVPIPESDLGEFREIENEDEDEV